MSKQHDRLWVKTGAEERASRMSTMGEQNAHSGSSRMRTTGEKNAHDE